MVRKGLYADSLQGVHFLLALVTRIGILAFKHLPLDVGLKTFINVLLVLDLQRDG